MARKPDLPGAADFFQTGASKRAEKKPSKQTASQTDQKQPADTVSASPDDRAQERPATQKNAPDTLTADMQSLSVEPPQTIEQPPTEKVTFYLPARMLEDLEVCRVRLLTEYKLKVNRSQITQAALALTLNRPELICDALIHLDELARELQQT